MSKTPTREAKTQALIPVSRGQIVKAGELAEKGGTTVVGEFGGSVPPALLWVKLHVNALGETIPDDRIARMLDALTDEMQWRKRPLTDGEFRDLLHTVCNSSSSAH